MVPIDLADSMRFEPASRGITLVCSDPTLPTDDRNLVVRAAKALASKFSVRKGVKIVLEKRIPIGGGLGGGSSNAATTLQALNQLWRIGAMEPVLRKIGAQLGADVPFFLQRQPAVCTGRGDQIWPLNNWDALRHCWFFLANPGFGVATKWAYEHWGARQLKQGMSMERRPALTLPLEVTKVARLFENSLEAPVFAKFPILALLKAVMLRNGALGATMSGSGATMFGLVEERSEGVRLAKVLRTRFGAGLWTYVARCHFVT